MDITVIDSESIDPIESIKNLIQRPDIARDKFPFYLVSLDELLVRHKLWTSQLPRVKPFYAIKCNPDPALLRIMAHHLNTGFDCASQQEIKTILDLGVSPDRIIYAHPIKQSTYLDYAFQTGVDYMTFDCLEELVKIKKHHPKAKCLVRIKADDSTAIYKLNNKFGVDVESACRLVKEAVEIGVEIVGVCFHVGCEQKSPDVYKNSLREARQVFDYARENLNLKLRILDIGGGYPGETDLDDLFLSEAKSINLGLDEYFPQDLFEKINGTSEERRLRIYAEPGKFFPSSLFTICTNIIGKKVQEVRLGHKKNGQVDIQRSVMYYINSGKYSAFRYYDKAKYFPIIIDKQKTKKEKHLSSIWGATCDGADVVYENLLLPELEIDDYLAFVKMGGYISVFSTDFNGIPLPRPIYAVTKSLWSKICHLFK